MAEHTLLNLDLVETNLNTALNSSIMDFNSSINNNIDVWAQTDLRRNVENQMSEFGSSISSNGRSGSGNFSGGGPGDGLKFTIGLQVMIGYSAKPKWKLDANLGYQKRWNNFAANASINASLYNGGLGTAHNSNKMEFDLTAAANIIIGHGHGKPLQAYTINNNSPIPNLNEFKDSIRYGQALTYNSAVNNNNFSLDHLQREGLVGFRVGNVNVSTNNDTARFPYYGGGTDKGWTGGISLVTPLLEVGSQTFTGDYFEQDDIRTNALKLKIENATSPEEKSRYQKELVDLTRNFFHTQTKYQKSLNKSSLYIRHNNNTIDFIGDAYLQNFIHKSINNHMFEFEHKATEISIGQNF